jgi:hypothetical protein
MWGGKFRSSDMTRKKSAEQEVSRGDAEARRGESVTPTSGVYGFVEMGFPGVSLRYTLGFNSVAPFGRWGAKVRLRRCVRIVLGDHDPPALCVVKFY